MCCRDGDSIVEKHLVCYMYIDIYIYIYNERLERSNTILRPLFETRTHHLKFLTEEWILTGSEA